MKRLTFWSFVCFLILLLSLGSLSVAESFLNDSQPFLDALRQEAETFSFSDADLAAVIDTQDSHAEAFLRNDEGAFEIAIPGAGRLFISEQEIGLEAGEQRYIVDLASISQRIQQWTGRDGSREADRAFLQSLLVKFWDDVILPGVRFSEIGESITLHIQLDQGSLSQRADQYLREVLEMPETAELYDRYAPLFRLSQIGLPGSFSEFRKGLEAAPQETAASGFPSLEADLVIHSGLGGKKEISCIGTLYDADLYSYQLKVVFRELEGGWSCRGELTGGRDYTSGMNLDLLFRDGLLSGSASAGSVHLDLSSERIEQGGTRLTVRSNLDWTAFLDFFSDSVQAKVLYFQDEIDLTVHWSEEMLQASLETHSPNSVRTYDYDLLLYRSEDDSLSLRLLGNNSYRDRRTNTHDVSAVIGPSQLGIHYTMTDFFNDVQKEYRVALRSEEDGKFSLELQLPPQRYYGLEPSTCLSLRREGGRTDIRFSYPYRLWLVSGEGFLSANRAGQLRSIQGTVTTSYLSDPGKKETCRILWSPGQFIYTDPSGIWKLSKTEDTASRLRYEVTHNAEQAYEITAEQGRSEAGRSLLLSLSDASSTLLKVQIREIEKEALTAIDREGAILIDADTLEAMLLSR